MTLTWHLNKTMLPSRISKKDNPKTKPYKGPALCQGKQDVVLRPCFSRSATNGSFLLTDPESPFEGQFHFGMEYAYTMVNLLP